jgi:DNA-binding CsgD family transcriptional regulator
MSELFPLSEAFEDLHSYFGKLPFDPEVEEYRDTYLDCDEVRKIFHMGSQFFYITDLSKPKFIFISESIRDVLGYSPEEFTIDSLLDFIHPADRGVVIKATGDSFEKIYQNPSCDPLKTHINLNFRMLHKDGTYMHVLRQSAAWKLDKKGNILYLLCMVTDINQIKSDNQIQLRISFPGEKEISGSYTILNADTGIFSSREKEIIRLVAKGNKSKEIAETLNISYNTVITHRRNILKKAELKNTVELLTYSKELRII